jgi:hypothetical protein
MDACILSALNTCTDLEFLYQPTLKYTINNGDLHHFTELISYKSGPELQNYHFGKHQLLCYVAKHMPQGLSILKQYFGLINPCCNCLYIMLNHEIPLDITMAFYEILIQNELMYVFFEIFTSIICNDDYYFRPFLECIVKHGYVDDLMSYNWNIWDVCSNDNTQLDILMEMDIPITDDIITSINNPEVQQKLRDYNEIPIIKSALL